MAQYFSPKIVTSGLSLFVDAANPKSYAGSGTNWGDISGNSRNMTLTGSPVYSGPPAANFSFTGYASVAHSSDFNNGSAITVECVVRASSWSSQTHPMIVAKGVNTEWILWKSDDAGADEKFGWRMGAGATLYSTTTAQNNLWYHLTATIGSAGMRLYVNSAREASNATTSIPAGASASVAVACGLVPTVSNTFAGSVSFVRIYSRQLSDVEVLQNFEATRGRFGI